MSCIQTKFTFSNSCTCSLISRPPSGWKCYNVIRKVVLMCLSILYFPLFFFFSFCPGQYPAHESPGLPHSVSHPVTLRQRQQRLSRSGTITPHFPVSPARRTSSRYKWTRSAKVQIHRHTMNKNINATLKFPLPFFMSWDFFCPHKNLFLSNYVCTFVPC